MLGALVGSWLLQHRAAHLMLLGRSASRLPPGLPLASSHAAVIAMQCDVSAASDAPLLVARPFDSPAVGGLLHSGGALADATLPRQTPSAMRRAFAPKVDGAMKLRQALRGCGVGPCVLFSSVAGLMGSPGQASYSAANAALDGLAGAWAAEGSAAVAVQWGAWAGGGMAARDSGTVRRLARMGLGALEPEVGLAALEGVLATQCKTDLAASQVAISMMNWEAFVLTAGPAHIAAPSEILSADGDLSRESSSVREEEMEGRGSSVPPAGVVEPAGPEDLERLILSCVRSVVDGLGEGDEALTQPLHAVGLDSLGTVELRHVLQRELGVEVAPTLLFDYPTIRDMAAFLHPTLTPTAEPSLRAAFTAERLVPASGGPSGAARVPVGDVSRALVGVASISCRLPPKAQLSGGQLSSSDHSSVLPLNRWDVEYVEESHKGVTTAVRHGVFIEDDVTAFDLDVFSMSVKEAVLMDPQQRLLLECAAEQIAAGPPAADAGNGQGAALTGVYVGIWQSDYQDLTGALDVTPYHATGSSVSVAAGRVSYTFSLRGASMSVDTACSASMVAAHLAKTALHQGECSKAFAMGVGLILSTGKYLALDAAGMLSVSGRCHSFDAAADGYARGESAVSLFLERLEAFQADEFGTPSTFPPRRVALLAGSAVNQDGRSSSLTVPNGPAQQNALCSACASAAVDPSFLGGVQSHGTGTPLGDPIETGALSSVLSQFQGSDPATLQANKSMFAHTEAAAGLMATMCAVSMISHRSACSVQHLLAVNPYICDHLSGGNGTGDDRRGPVLLCPPRQQRPHSSAANPRQNAVCSSSFAYQGTNSILVTTPAGQQPAPGLTPARMRWQHWQRAWCWAKAVRSHPLLTTASFSHRAPAVVTLEGPVHWPTAAYFHDHRVQDQAIMPGACYVEMASSAASQLRCSSGKPLEQSSTVAAVVHCKIPQPLLLGGNNTTGSRTRIQLIASAVDGTLKVGSIVTTHPQGQTHLTGRVAAIALGTHSHDRRALGPGQMLLANPGKTVRLLAGSNVTATPTRGSGFRSASTTHSALVIHPAVLDALLQLGGQLGSSQPDTSVTYVPAGMEAVRLGLTDSERDVAVSSRMCSSSSVACLVMDHRLVDDSGSSGYLSGFEARPIKVQQADRQSSANAAATVRGGGKAASGMEDSTLVTQWAVDKPSRWHRPEPRSDHSRLVGPHMVARDGRAESPAHALCLAAEAVAQQAFSAGHGCLRISSSRGIGNGWQQMAPRSIGPHGQFCWDGLWGVVQTVAAECVGAMAVVPETGSPGATGHVGSAGLYLEPSVHGQPQHLQSTAAGAALTGVLVRSSATNPPPPHHLVPHQRGTFNCLKPAPVNIEGLRDSEVCLKVEAVGINFRDVLNVLGMYPGDPGNPGADMAGTVVSVGGAVTSLRVGQAVFGLSPGCLGSHITTTPETLAALPPCVSFSQAATMPTVSVTVKMALRAAGAAAGQAVLVHAAAGGVGLQAIQQMHANRLVVIATAGSAAKRSIIRTLGVQHVYDSRSTSFVEDCTVAGLGGASMVLNSLTSSGMVAASISTLKVGGCFVELSKRDIWGADRIAAERPDLRHQLLAMDFLPVPLLHAYLAEVAVDLAEGRLRPLPAVMHPMAVVASALRQMSQVGATPPCLAALFVLSTPRPRLVCRSLFSSLACLRCSAQWPGNSIHLVPLFYSRG